MSNPPTDAMAKTAISVAGVSKAYSSRKDPVLALDRVSLEVKRGEFVCLVGASGCGKSTLLNLLAGLDTPSAGDLHVEGRPGLMFQDPALLPWLSAVDNVAMPLRLAGVDKVERRAKAEEYLELVRLFGQGEKRPHELSGGMRQRVSLARALAQGTEILLMDEPFAAVDAMTRDVLHDELERIWQASGMTVVFVTHNVGEAVRLGDRILLLTSRPGRVAEEFPVDIARPRRIDSPEVSALASHVTDQLRKEVRRHAND